MSKTRQQAKNHKITAWVFFALAATGLLKKALGVPFVSPFGPPTTISGAIGAQFGELIFYVILAVVGIAFLMSSKNKALEASYEDGSYKNR